VDPDEEEDEDDEDGMGSSSKKEEDEDPVMRKKCVEKLFFCKRILKTWFCFRGQSSSWKTDEWAQRPNWRKVCSSINPFKI